MMCGTENSQQNGPTLSLKGGALLRGRAVTGHRSSFPSSRSMSYMTTEMQPTEKPMWRVALAEVLTGILVSSHRAAGIEPDTSSLSSVKRKRSESTVKK